MKKSAFNKTSMSYMQKYFIQVYGEERGKIVLYDAEKVLINEYSKISNNDCKAIKFHLTKYVLPCYACYVKMIDEGMSKEEALEVIKEVLYNHSVRLTRILKKFSNKPYTYSLFRFVLKFVLNLLFPKQGWTIESVENNKNFFKFNMKSCLYLEKLKQLEVPELCNLFCCVDFVTFSPLSPAVRFIRENTLAEGKNNCDFYFERGN